MTQTAPDGAFHLGPGVRLRPGKADTGVLIQPDPLRAIRVNPSARRLLETCRNGLPAREIAGNPNVMAFFDNLCQARLLDWRPRPWAEGEDAPFVSIVVPVYNRADDIGECLASLLALNYPESRREIIVVDDGSTDPTADAAAAYPVRLLRLTGNQGQSAARNQGAAAATGDLVAFMDSDCIADPDWLSELVPCFQDNRVTLVGGYVDAYYSQTRLDRFEAVGSPLKMGDGALTGAGDKSVLYVPTCNLLVRRTAYLEAGGLDPLLRVGEDVDLCWRMMNAGHRILYVPRGRVKHKHRNRFWPGFVRRFDYGASEPALYAAHARAAKRFPWQTGGVLFLGLAGLGAVVAPMILLPSAGAVLLVEAALRKQGMDRMTAAPLGFRTILRATLRSHLLLAFYLTHHIIRYHLMWLAALSILFPRLAPLVLGLMLFPTAVSYIRKRPRTDPLSYGFFFIMAQLFYGAGVFWGSVRRGHLKCYRIAFANAGFLKKTGRTKWTLFRANTKT